MYWKFAIVGVIALGLVTIIGLGYRHYNGLLEDIDTLEKNNVLLEQAVDLQQDTIREQREAIDAWIRADSRRTDTLEEMQQVAHRATEQIRRLNDIFSRHDLEDLALRRPGLIERRINSGTDRAGRMLECASGSTTGDCPD